ncbi:formate dehydrogenase accessory sulfurtransferase FdhD [Microvirga sp. CF3062]|uniref:formate dehydrogenase accessory sulfurtransferase FdhD n=1 Tax=Microvirga sp. CF3062 TaxID=3110182 RepID=UPI002E79B411|nr:formate dehydrogenase accessory sulfurtransferase FdhD [Microvirga sp. CF3062]MEE1656236.1 formate dehydrogenase accessory sulfurtransferase FdhD [Microvirga sp. CF3062]
MSLHLEPVIRLARTSVAKGTFAAGDRVLPEETPVALTYNGSTHAVMMASPADLEDFALGFSQSEGIIAGPDDLLSMEIIEHDLGCEIRMWLSETCSGAYRTRRRAMAGPVGCGICGVESLAEAIRPAPKVAGTLQLHPGAIAAAIADLSEAQRLNREARAIHAAALWRPDQGLIEIREDVGRHNALDKLAGALARANETCSAGMVLLTSRVSVEMVQKTARMGAPIIAAISAPTALAVRVAEGCGLTLVGIVREDSFEVFTHPERVQHPGY